MNNVVNQINYLGNIFFVKLKTVIDIIIIFINININAIGLIFRRKKTNRSIYTQTIYQILFTGIEAMPLVSIIALATGIIFIVQSINNMPQFGVSEYFGKITIILIRDIGPTIISLIVIARSGSAFSVYIGNMKVNREISALESMGINPETYLILPAYIGMIISIISLNFYFGLIASIGGLFVASLVLKIPFIIFSIKIISSANFLDIISLIVKGIINGAIISTISGFYGLHVKNIREVSMAVIKAVVSIIITTFLINVIISGGLYLYNH